MTTYGLLGPSEPKPAPDPPSDKGSTGDHKPGDPPAGG